MVSWDTRISGWSGKSRRSERLICSGLHRFLSPCGDLGVQAGAAGHLWTGDEHAAAVLVLPR